MQSRKLRKSLAPLHQLSCRFCEWLPFSLRHYNWHLEYQSVISSFFWFHTINANLYDCPSFSDHINSGTLRLYQKGNTVAKEMATWIRQDVSALPQYDFTLRPNSVIEIQVTRWLFDHFGYHRPFALRWIIFLWICDGEVNRSSEVINQIKTNKKKNETNAIINFDSILKSDLEHTRSKKSMHFCYGFLAIRNDKQK